MSFNRCKFRLLFFALISIISQQKVIAQAPPLLWQRCYGGDTADVINCVRQTPDGGFIAAGYTYSVDGELAGNGGITGDWVLKLDDSGNIQWEKTYNDTLTRANYIEPTYDGGYILSGNQTMKLSSDGSIQWIDNIPGFIIHQTTDSGYILCYENNTYSLTKLHPDGSIDWEQGYNDLYTNGTVMDVCESFLQDGYIITGYIVDIFTQPFIAKTDLAGNLPMPISDYETYVHGIGEHLCNTSDSEYAYYTHTSPAYGNQIAKFDDGLTVKWSKRITATGSSIAGTNDGGVVLWGRDTVPDMTLMKFDTGGNQVWTAYINGSSTGLPTSVLQLPNGNCVLSAGVYSNDSEISGVHGGEDGWMAELGFGNTRVPGITPGLANIKIYPNPSITELTISATDNITTITVSNLLGQVVYSQQCNSQQVQVNIAKLPAGVYLMRINGSEVRKFVKK